MSSKIITTTYNGPCPLCGDATAGEAEQKTNKNGNKFFSLVCTNCDMPFKVKGTENTK